MKSGQRKLPGQWRALSLLHGDNDVDKREGEAKFLRCSLYYEGAFSIMEPAEFSSISL